MSEANRTPEPAEQINADAVVAEAGTGAATGENPQDMELELPTYEDDESAFTVGMRAVVTLIAGCLLAYAQWKAPISPAQEWGRWVGNSVISNFLLPLGIVWFFFGQTLRPQEWMKDQKHNGWNFGWKFSPIKRFLLQGGAMWLVLLPFLIYFSRLPSVRTGYTGYLPAVAGPQDYALALGGLVLYMFCWEWFFRGFLLFGMAQGFGWIVAVILQAVVFGFAHSGKPPIEMYGAFAGGLILGTLCWREKSFVPAFIAHALIHVTWTILLWLP